MWSLLFGRAAKVTHVLSDQLARIAHEAERLGEEAISRALEIWDQLDELPFVPDAFKIPPIRRQLYAHGAFMGAAPALLADEHWRRTLAFLMPDVYTDVTARLADDPDPSALIPMFENNPVMAAYGIWHSTHSADHDWALDLMGVEWDLFIDGDLAEEYTDAAPEDRPAIIEQVLRTAVIAHANALDTLQENLGFCQHRDVRRTAKSKLGGVEVASWLDLFARALLLAQADDPAPLLVEMAAEPRVTLGEACELYTFVEPIYADQAVALFREVSGKDHFSVVMDMKSLRSTPELFAALIRALNAEGIHVTAAASFKLEEIAGLSEVTQVINGEELPGPREVLFFHYAGDLQRALHRGSIPEGMSVLFNAACLIQVDGVWSETAGYRINDAVVDDIARYQRRHQLDIGLYVQEGDCDSAAAALINDIVDRWEDTFTLGFAWGGLRELAAFAPGDEPRLGHGSQLALTFVGAATRDWTLSEDEDNDSPD